MTHPPEPYQQLWNERYGTEQFVFGTEPNEFVRSMAHHFIPQGQTLAIAEGEGRNAVYLTGLGQHVTCWDYSEVGLAKCRQLATQRQVEVDIRCINLTDVDWGQERNRWDQVICIFGHFPAELRQQTLAGVKDAIRPGGYYLSEVYSTSQLAYGTGGPKDVELLYRPQYLLDAFADWSIVHFFMGEVIRNEGIGHQGLSHLIQILAQRK
jgi:hypothetical protein